MAAVGDAVRMPLYRPLAGDDKIEIMNAARKIGTYDISAEPFHDCCPIFLPRNPALHASIAELDQAESTMDIEALIRQSIDTMAIERYRYAAGQRRKSGIVQVRYGVICSIHCVNSVAPNHLTGKRAARELARRSSAVMSCELVCTARAT